jgi:hypothetical protein
MNEKIIEEIKKDFERFVRLEAMRLGYFTDEIEKIIRNE